MQAGASGSLPSGGKWKHGSIYGEEIGTPPIQLLPNLQIFRYAHRGGGKTWYARYYREDLKRYKPTCSLKTSDLELAKIEASILYGEIRTRLSQGIEGDALTKTIDDLLDEWISDQTKRYKSGEISVTLWRNKRRSADIYIRNYVRWKKWDPNKPEKIPISGWSDYRFWRLTEGWKLSQSSHGQKPPKDSTINLEIGFIREWYNDKLISEGFATRKPSVKKAKIATDDLDANPPFTPKDYALINKAIHKWVHDESANERNKKWRIVVGYFFQCSMSIGWRPESEGLKTRWTQVKIWEEAVPYDFGDDVGILEESECNAFLLIKDTKNKRVREADYPVGRLLLGLRDKYNQWHSENPSHYPKPGNDDYLFHVPENGFKRDPHSRRVTEEYIHAGQRQLSYSSVSKAWSDILLGAGLTRIGDQGNLLPKYTIRSARSWYVTNRLRNGTDIFLVCKASGHDIVTCRRHYERLNLREKRKELTRDTNTPNPFYHSPSKNGDQDALDFESRLSDEIIEKNRQKHQQKSKKHDSYDEKIRLLEELLRDLRQNI